MRKRDRQLVELSRRLDTLGISLSDQEALRRIEMTLHRWAERECSGEIERDEKTGKLTRVYRFSWAGRPNETIQRAPVPDLERGALKRLAVIMSKYPALWYYHQGDPRGCALYVGRWADIPEDWGLDAAKGPTRRLDAHYTRGVAVCL